MSRIPDGWVRGLRKTRFELRKSPDAGDDEDTFPTLVFRDAQKAAAALEQDPSYVLQTVHYHPVSRTAAVLRRGPDFAVFSLPTTHFPITVRTYREPCEVEVTWVTDIEYPTLVHYPTQEEAEGACWVWLDQHGYKVVIGPDITPDDEIE